MWAIKIVYNGNIVDSKSFVEDLVKELDEIGITYEVYDTQYAKEYKKGVRIKASFGARIDPFVGITYKNKIYKGFYSEEGKLKFNTIIDTIKNLPKSPIEEQRELFTKARKEKVNAIVVDNIEKIKL